MWREDEDQSNRDHPPMASDAASDIFAMLTPTQASPDALASAPSSASDARPPSRKRHPSNMKNT